MTVHYPPAAAPQSRAVRNRTPLTTEAAPLLTCDVWERAYHMDYKNQRAKFVDTFLGNPVNWEFLAERLGEAQG